VPAPAFDLSIELPCSPAGVTGDGPELGRAALLEQLLEEYRALAHVDIIDDRASRLRLRLGSQQHEHAALSDGTAEIDRILALLQALDLGKHLAQLDVAATVDDQPQRAIRIVGDQQNHGSGEVGVAHSFGCDQQLARCRLWAGAR